MARSLFIRATDWLEALVTPPCRGAHIAVWLGFAAFFFFNKTSFIWHGNLDDPDDYLYLVQAIDWLNGQNWYDLIQHRMDPPQGTFIHYSHLLSGFYACIIALLRPLCGTIMAAILTAAIVPLIYFAIFLLMLRKLAQLLIAPQWGDFTAVIILVSPIVLSQFWVGAIHHHGVEMIMAVSALYALARMVMAPQDYKWAIAAGFLLALGLALGLEIIAVLGLFSLCTGVWAMIEGGSTRRSGLIFSATMFVASFVFLTLTRAPQHLFDIIIPAYSIVYVVFTGCIAFCFACLFLVGDKLSTMWRCLCAGVIASVTGGLFLTWFPELRAGPYGGADPALTRLIFFSEPEAWPGLHADLPWGPRILPAIWPSIAIASNIFIFLEAKTRSKRWLWGIVLVLLSACTGFAEFYQCRFFNYAQPFAALPLVAMLRHDWELTAGTYAQQFRRVTRLLFVMLIGPVTFSMSPSHFINAAFDNNSFPGLANKELKGCDMHYLADLLNDKAGLGDHSQIIINTLNEGPELLLRTQHSVLAGPYHLNLNGNMDAFDFFTAPGADVAREIAEKRHASLVVICALPSQLRAYALENRQQDSFIRQLIAGQIPNWMSPITSPQLDDLMLFKIEGMN